MKGGPICPNNMWQLFYPLTLWIVQPLLESIHYNFIDNLSLTIPLWISWNQVPICDTQFATVTLESFSIKLKSIIRDEDMWDLEPSNNIFPYKSLGIHISDVWQGLSFDPFGEIISSDQQSSPISYCLREGPHNVQAPLRKRPRVKQRVENTPWLMNIWGIPPTLIALLHVVLRIPLHIRPPIPLGEGPMR